MPASLCKIGLIDGLYSCIHLTETIVGDEYGFSEEMQDLAKIFRLATNRSLILLDEFGRSKFFFPNIILISKDAPYSVSLSSCIALVKYLTQDHFRINNTGFTFNNPMMIEDPLYDKKVLYDRIPTTLLITHHKEIFQNRLIEENYIIRFFTMEAVVQNGNNYYSFLRDLNQIQQKNPNHKYINMKEGINITQIEDQDRVIFMYRAKPGFSVNSFSVFCAKQVGFEKEVLERINEIQRLPQDQIHPNRQIIKKHDDTVRDLLFQVNDFLCSIKIQEEKKLDNFSPRQ